MGRPSKRLDAVMRFRMSESMKEKLEIRAKEEGVSVSELLRGWFERATDECVEEAQTEKTISEVSHEKNVSQNVSHEQEEIKSMCSFFELDERDFYGQIYRYFQSGEITIEEGKVILKPEGMLDTEAFVMACEEKYIDPKEAFEEAIKRIYTSQIGGAGGK